MLDLSSAYWLSVPRRPSTMATPDQQPPFQGAWHFIKDTASFIQHSPTGGCTGCPQPGQEAQSRDALQHPVTVSLCHLRQTPQESLSRHRRRRRRSSCWHSRSSGPPESLSCCCPVKKVERAQAEGLPWNHCPSCPAGRMEEDRPMERFLWPARHSFPGTVISTSHVASYLILKSPCAYTLSLLPFYR